MVFLHRSTQQTAFPYSIIPVLLAFCPDGFSFKGETWRSRVGHVPTFPAHFGASVQWIEVDRYLSGVLFLEERSRKQWKRRPHPHRALGLQVLMSSKLLAGPSQALSTVSKQEIPDAFANLLLRCSSSIWLCFSNTIPMFTSTSVEMRVLRVRLPTIW